MVIFHKKENIFQRCISVSGHFVLKDYIACLRVHPRIFIKENYLYNARNILNINSNNARHTRNYKISTQDLKKSVGVRVKKWHTQQKSCYSSLKTQYHIYLYIPKPSTIQAYSRCMTVIEKTKKENSIC